MIRGLKILMVFCLGWAMASCADTPVGPDANLPDNDIDSTASDTYTNAVLEASGDPFCIEIDGRYYLYLPDQNGDGSGGTVKCWTSTDLVHWEAHGTVYDNTGHTYGGQRTTNLWAPEVMAHKGKFYLFVVNVMSGAVDSGPGDKDIVVIEGDTPTSFTGKKTILLNDPYAFIDPSPFIDPADGNLYLTYKKRGPTGTGSQINIQAMTDTITMTGEAAMIFHSDGIPDAANVLEHPHIRKEGEKYFLFFSKNSGKTPAYKIDYGVATSVMGDYRHKGTLFQSDSDLSGNVSDHVIAPGGSSIVLDGAGRTWMVYRQKSTTTTTFADRVVCIDPIEIFPEKESAAGKPGKGVIKPAPVPL